MASILNAVRNISSDPWWAVKIVVMAYPIFFFLENKEVQAFDSTTKMSIYLFLFALYLGVAGFLMHKNINNKSPIMPSLFTIPEYISRTFFMTLISVPVFALYYLCMNAIYTYVLFEPIVMYIIYGCVTLFFSPFLFIPAVLYAANGKFLDAFYFKSVLEGGGNFSVQFLSFIIQYIFTIFFTAYLFYQLFYNMVAIDTPLNIVISITVVFSFLSLYSYCSDMYDAEIPPLPIKKKKSKR